MSNPFVASKIPAELAEIISTHQALFGGFTMVADPADADNGAEGGDDGADKGADDAGKSDKDAKSEELGAGGTAALKAERAARKALEKQLTELSGVKATLEAMKAAMAGKVEGKPEDAVKELAQQVDDLKRQALVERVAREHKITSDEDVELLSAMRSEEELRALAVRLKPSDDAGDGKDDKKGGGKPRPDASRGQGGGDSAASKSVAEIQAERRAAREAKPK